ncbi:MAG: shikimate dehydrogenase, partial [Proteobacteria bacterium]|nr:shikimate dehydrogenase [Pseudomonadota bacterium]
MSKLSGTSRIAGVAGWPVAHSLSPRLHGYWLDQYGVDGAYVPLPIRPERALDAMRALPLLGFAGANVTLPLKQAAFAVADETSPLARRVGAVNTLVCRPDGSIFGDNTDAYGFITNLRLGAPGWRADAGPSVVLGAGGSARAVLAALLD